MARAEFRQAQDLKRHLQRRMKGLDGFVGGTLSLGEVIMRFLDLMWSAKGRCVLGLGVITLCGCGQDGQTEQLWGGDPSDVASFRIEQSGTGGQVEEGKRNFAEGFVLCTGPWEVYQVWIIQGDQVTGVWSDFSKISSGAEGGEINWRGNQWVLTQAQREKIAVCLGNLRGQLGRRYVNSKIADGMVLSLYETPNAQGKPVLESSNAGIEPLDELYGVLLAMTGNPRMTMKALVDEETRRIAERAIQGGR